MLTKTKTRRLSDEPEDKEEVEYPQYAAMLGINRFLEEPLDIEEAEYPQEVIDRWDREFEIAEEQIATGELKPMTIAEIAEKAGIKRDAKY